ncbi:MAG: hypothetical protein AAFW68_12070 [Pseudomonadota bacterium]
MKRLSSFAARRRCGPPPHPTKKAAGAAAHWCKMTPGAKIYKKLSANEETQRPAATDR